MQEYTVKIDAHGTTRWFKPGTQIFHRLDGPAVEYADGYKAWYQNGNRHRLDGPAIEYADGFKAWYIGGVKYTEAEFKAKINPVKELTVAEISTLLGYEVKVVK